MAQCRKAGETSLDPLVRFTGQCLNDDVNLRRQPLKGPFVSLLLDAPKDKQQQRVKGWSGGVINPKPLLHPLDSQLATVIRHESAEADRRHQPKPQLPREDASKEQMINHLRLLNAHGALIRVLKTMPFATFYSP
jgi:hypothetical protein